MRLLIPILAMTLVAVGVIVWVAMAEFGRSERR